MYVMCVKKILMKKVSLNYGDILECMSFFGEHSSEMVKKRRMKQSICESVQNNLTDCVWL